MFIGPFEAQAIALPLQGVRPSRPYTHDLMLAALHRLKAKVNRVVITGLRDNTYFADLVLDSRPSDAIAPPCAKTCRSWRPRQYARSPRAATPDGGERTKP